MAIFVLISGAWHAGWCWERVVPKLQAAGHQALAPDLLGMGEDKTPLCQISLEIWAKQIAALIKMQSEPVILVGHSRGGVVISAAAELVPNRIKTLAYLAAFLLPPGETLLAMSTRTPRENGDILLHRPDGTSTVRPEAVGPAFYNTTAPEWVARAVAFITPEPMALFTTKLPVTPARYGSVPRAYIECTEDRAVPLVLQREMQDALPCDPVFTLSTDHSPFYSDPDALTSCLLQLAEA